MTMKKLSNIVWLISVLCILMWSCEGEDELDIGFETDIVTEIQVVTNPSGYAPLTATINVSTITPAVVRLRVVGKNGAASDVIHGFPGLTQSFDIPVLGLYPDIENTVELSFFDANGTPLGTETVIIETDPLIAEMPDITIDRASSGEIKPGMNLVNYFGHNGEFLPQRPFIFDEFGDIRWFIDFSDDPVLSSLFFDNGMNRLKNGNMIFGDGNSGALYEMNMLGEIENSWSLQGFGFHHHVIEKPNGNFLVTVNNNTIPTVEDWILEMDRVSGEIVNEWDLNQSLDNGRRAWPTNRADLNVDWFHANAIEYSEADDAIIVSGRTQGTVKLTADNQVIWILAPHREWELAGDGTALSSFLLQPLDAQGNPIEDPLVLSGERNHPDFEWAWYQHSPIILPNGNLMLFDNGDNRNYEGANRYSRAVEYEIDEANMTIQQVWSYGKEREGETYSPIVSKVSFHVAEGNVLFTPGAIEFNGDDYGKVVEVDRSTNQILFEATVRPPIAPFDITFHNVQRMSLY